MKYISILGQLPFIGPFLMAACGDTGPGSGTHTTSEPGSYPMILFDELEFGPSVSLY